MAESADITEKPIPSSRDMVVGLFVAYAMGALVILVLPSTAMAAKAIAVSAIVIGYYVFLRDSAKARGWSHEFGDSVYYLGFGLTISALIIGVWKSFGAGGEARSADQLLGQFGAALTSTLAGVGCRITERLLRLSPEENLDEAIQRVRELAKELSLSLEDINNRTRGTVEQNLGALDKGIDDASRILGEKSVLLHQRLDEIADSLSTFRVDSAPLRDSFAQLRQSAQAANQHMSKHVESLSKTTEKLTTQADKIGDSFVKAGNAMASQVSAVEHGARTLAEGTSGVTARLDSLSAQLSRISNQFGDIAKEDWGTAAKEISAALKTLGDELKKSESIGAHLAATAAATRGLEESVVKLASEVSSEGRDITSAVRDLSALSKKTRQLSAALDEILEVAEAKVNRLS